MLIDVSVLMIALAIVALVAYLISTLIQLRKTLVEGEQLLIHLNNEMPAVLQEARLVTQHLNALAQEARQGVEHASVFLHAVGDVGETVQHVHGLISGRGGGLVSRLASVLTGVKAASAVLKERFAKSDEEGNGKMPIS
jgi:uncharacterized protein YoxC